MEQTNAHRLPFLQGGGEMGELIRRHEWSRSSLGPPASWPQSLRTALRVLLNTGHPMYIFWGPDGLCFYNDAYRLCIGSERHPSSLGRPARAVWEEIWPTIGPQIDQVMSGRGATWHENQLLPITRNGVREDVYWTYSYGPIDDETAPSGVGGVLVVCTETTPQVQYAQRLAASEERLRMALQAGRGIGTWDWDVPTGTLVADETFARLYGVDPKRAAAGASVDEIFASMHGDDAARVRQSVGNAIRTGGPFCEEYRLVRPDGSIVWVVAEGRCVQAKDGVPARFPGVSFDITARKVAEHELRELNAVLERKVIERAQDRGKTWQVSPDLMGALNSDGHFTASNPAWGVVLGWSEAEVASMSIFELLHPDDVERTRAGFNLTREGVPAIRFPNRFRCKNGGYRWISWVGVPDGGVVYCSGRDITEEVAANEALERAETALRQSQKMEAVGQLTGGMAHDFNNLLTVISGSLELTQHRILEGRTDTVDRYLSAANGAVKRAAALTHRLLAFSRRQTLDPRPTNVSQLVKDMQELIRGTIGPGIHLEVTTATNLWSTSVDQNQLENSLLNLCINARDAMPDGGRLTISTVNKWIDEKAARDSDIPPGQYVALLVTDAGTGMPPDIVAKAFDPFFTTKPIGQGTGLGLSMIYGFARQSGGDVRIHSVVGEGTTMCVCLPRYIDDTVAETSVSATTEGDRRAGDGQCILVVEDEPVIRMLIAEVLGESGFKVIEAFDGPSAMRVLESSAAVDLMVTDVGLPGGMNGRRVADAARTLRPALKVLFITGYAEITVIGQDRLDAGTAVMIKPFEMEELLGKIAEMART